MTEGHDVISVTPVTEPSWGEAIRFLEQAVKAGSQDEHALYLLAMAYKHKGRAGEARQMLAKIADPDANVLLQRGLLAFNDKEWLAAAGEFDKGELTVRNLDRDARENFVELRQIFRQ